MPVIGRTASAVTQELAAGMDLYLSRPLRAQDLSEAVRAIDDDTGTVPASR